MENPNKLRIVKEQASFVVQIRRKKFWTRKWWWQYMDIYLYRKYKHLPSQQTVFGSKEKAESFCVDYLTQEFGEDCKIIQSINNDEELYQYSNGKIEDISYTELYWINNKMKIESK